MTCVPFDMVQPWIKIEPVTEGPKAYNSASDHSVEVVGSIHPLVKFQNGVIGRVRMKVLRGLKRPLFSTCTMVEEGGSQ